MQSKPHFYGRRRTRSLRGGVQKLFNETLGNLTFDIERCQNIFEKPVWIEIGFGGGEHMLARAVQNPDVNFIGCEPFINGVANLVRDMKQAGVSNVLLHADDVRLLLPKLADQCLDRAFLLFPDPWPKKKHHKRRFFNLENITQIHRLLKTGGLWHIATDHVDYGDWIAEKLNTEEVQKFFKVQQFWNVGERPSLQDWPATRYEQKALSEGRQARFWIIKKV